MVAHGASRGKKCANLKAAERRQSRFVDPGSVAPSGAKSLGTPIPRLTPWAISTATPWLATQKLT